MAFALLIAAAAALSLGAVDVSLRHVAAVLARKVGMSWVTDPGRQAEAVVWGIRAPRLLTGLMVGAGLATTGVLLQGVTRNELADPQLLGIGPGAAIGAAIGAAVGGVGGSIAGGAVAGVLTAFVVRRLRRRSSLDPIRFILSGVALGAALSAWVGFIVFAADRSVVPPIEFWLLGGLSGSTWRTVATTSFFVVLGLAAMFTSTRVLDLLSLGAREAWFLGVDVDLATTVLFIVAGWVVGVTVGAAGVIVFVGLLVPFLMRTLVGPAHRHLLPAAMLGGALFLVSADIVARLLLDPIEIPVGLVTAALGGPLFVWLTSRRSNE